MFLFLMNSSENIHNVSNLKEIEDFSDKGGRKIVVNLQAKWKVKSKKLLSSEN